MSQMKRACWTLPGVRTGRPRGSSTKREPGGQPGWLEVAGDSTVPLTRRRMSGFWAGVKSWTCATWKAGGRPCTRRSPRRRSPSVAKASSRMASIREASVRALATVKSQARSSEPPADPGARAGVRKSDAMCGRRAAKPRSPREPVAVAAEGRARPQGAAVGAAQPPQGHDVAVALGEVHGGADEQVAGRVARRGVVDLGPDRVAAAGLRVDDDDRGALVAVAGQVGLRHRAGPGQGGVAVEAGEPRHEGRARAEPVGGVVVRGRDRDALRVAGHVRVGEVEPPPGGRAGVRPREVVVGPREQAGGRVERVAARRPRPRCEGERGQDGDHARRSDATPTHARLLRWLRRGECGARRA